MRDVLIQCLRVLYNRDLAQVGLPQTGAPAGESETGKSQGFALGSRETLARTVRFPTSIAARKQVPPEA
jgi:hypothetical protein